jgi:ADP-glucose pyrophosphorylase
VAIGAEARVGPDAQVDDSVVHPGGSIGAGARVLRSILGPGAHVGAVATVEDCVLGAGSTVPDAVSLSGQRVPTDTEAAPA